MKKNNVFSGSVFVVLIGISLLINATSALAHHPNGGTIPNTFFAGFVSGIGHPVIGIDHLVFVIAIGLLAASSKKLGMTIPIAFVVATAMGTLVHLQSISLPVPELIISASVLTLGIFLAIEQVNWAVLLTVGAIAGIFHGYAYGESIIGAENTALGAYLLGFCSIQLAISAIAFYLGRTAVARPNKSLILRFTGAIVSGIGFAFVSNAILG